MHILHAPGGIQIGMASLESLASMLGIPQVAQYIPANVLADSNVIPNRAPAHHADELPSFTTVRLTFASVNEDDLQELHDNVTKWAIRCRIPGVRGTRLAVIDSTSSGTSDDIKVEFNILLGTTVFYNARRATLGVSLSDDELLADVNNLLPYVPSAPLVEREDAAGVFYEVVEAPAFSVVNLTDPADNVGVFSIDILDPDHDPVALLTELRVAVAMLNPQDDPEVLINDLDDVQAKLDAFRATL